MSKAPSKTLGELNSRVYFYIQQTHWYIRLSYFYGFEHFPLPGTHPLHPHSTGGACIYIQGFNVQWNIYILSESSVHTAQYGSH